MLVNLLNGDCLELMKEIPNKSVDMVLCDLPYGTIKNKPSTWTNTNTKWDDKIDLTQLFREYNRVCRKNAKIVLFAQQPFTTELINISNNNITFSQNAIWLKNRPANILGCNKNLVNIFEDILIFTKNKESEKNDDNLCCKYAQKILKELNIKPQYIYDRIKDYNYSHFFTKGKQFRLLKQDAYVRLVNELELDRFEFYLTWNTLKEMDRNYKKTFKSIFNKDRKCKLNLFQYSKDKANLHPTQKPVALLEDLIKTYTNENELVLDNCMGSGSTGVACVNTNRNFIGIELSYKYFNIAKERIYAEKNKLKKKPLL